MPAGVKAPRFTIRLAGVAAEGGSQVLLSDHELAQRSNRVAVFLRRHGVERGHRILLMPRLTIRDGCGHRISPFERESALIEHEAVAEAAAGRAAREGGGRHRGRAGQARVLARGFPGAEGGG